MFSQLWCRCKQQAGAQQLQCSLGEEKDKLKTEDSKDTLEKIQMSWA